LTPITSVGINDAMDSRSEAGGPELVGVEGSWSVETREDGESGA